MLTTQGLTCKQIELISKMLKKANEGQLYALNEKIEKAIEGGG